MISCWFNGDNKRISDAINASKLLNIVNIKEKFSNTCGNIWYEEIYTEALGRLFITQDSFLSDGYFMEGYGKSFENLQKINSLVKEFSTFKFPLLNATIRNNLFIWPAQEPFSFIVDITNHGDKIYNADLIIDFSPNFEPLSSIERVIPFLDKAEKISFGFQLVPMVDGIYKNFINLEIKSSDGVNIPIYYPPLDIEIYPSYGTIEKIQNKQDDIVLSKLLSVSDGTNFLEEVKQLSKLIEVDIKACLSKLRFLAEKLCNMILKKQKNETYDSFMSKIKEMQKNTLLSAKSIGYLHTVRTVGNFASHPSNEKLTDIDVRLVSYALSCVLEEAKDNNLI